MFTFSGVMFRPAAPPALPVDAWLSKRKLVADERAADERVVSPLASASAAAPVNDQPSTVAVELSGELYKLPGPCAIMCKPIESPPALLEASPDPGGVESHRVQGEECPWAEKDDEDDEDDGHGGVDMGWRAASASSVAESGDWREVAAAAQAETGVVGRPGTHLS